MENNRGCVLMAGGRGRRMGNMDKARLSFQNVPFGARICQEAEKLGMPGYISTAAYPWEERPGWELVEDEIRDGQGQFIGPMGGLLSCLKRAREAGLDGLYTVPCDMPFFHKEQMRLLEPAPGEDGAVWRTRDGRIHPLCGYYRVSCIPCIEAMAERGEYRMRSLLEGLSVRVQDTSGPHIPDRWFANINRIGDYGRLQEQGAQPPVLAVCGGKNSGKTTLLIRLVERMSEVGIRCAVIKHDGHEFEADVPGTDSYRLKAAGAYGTAVYSGTKYSVVREAAGSQCQDFFRCFGDGDIIFLEGQKYSHYPKLELLRTGTAERPLADPAAVLAYVSDGFRPDPGLTGGRPVLDSEDLDQILETVLVFMDKSC